MRKILSLLSALLMLLTLASCSATGKDEAQTTTPSTSSNEAVEDTVLRELIDNGMLKSHVDYPLPATLAVMMDMVEQSTFEDVSDYDSIPKLARNISDYLFDGVLKDTSVQYAGVGTYKIVRYRNSDDDRYSILILDSEKREYKVFVFSGKKDYYNIYCGTFDDFKNEYFEKDEDFIKSAVHLCCVDADTNETLMCSYSLSVNDELINVIHDKNGDIIFCSCKNGDSVEYYDKSFNSITKEESDSLSKEFIAELNVNYGIEFPF